jgi:hypothetical protein
MNLSSDGLDNAQSKFLIEKASPDAGNLEATQQEIKGYPYPLGSGPEYLSHLTESSQEDCGLADSLLHGLHCRRNEARRRYLGILCIDERDASVSGFLIVIYSSATTSSRL